ncbi:iron hydrogenase small subunit family protein (macronuclear) [Tetrahymena thermophila SB210]|uniref:Iron hydrogenase small subunit family protein n=1 Tax=Tetrahymena thermophila (strain SB210) TaxID=312017 RepID=I7M2N9_TETTS|nr:iron hydrogenase small subunit family protein [Tetrahymena thermophila SB210]EAS00904.2 iron hydrogenase small subunit family protein [Tetrahymena thermophila SB210]|eukprot:XP_001021150.2 iron hydrogenase small subunit family protein [Tetrahymena thermophila SB210]
MKSKQSKHQSEKLLNTMQEMDKQSSEDTSIRDRIHKFYVCEMYKILKSFKRGPILTAILIAIYFSQVISNLFNENVLISLYNSSPSSKQFIYYMGIYFDYTKFYPIYSFLAQKNQNMNEEDAQTQFLIISCIFNAILLTYILIRMIHYIFWQYFTDISMSSQDSAEKLAKNSTYHSYLILKGDILFSFFFRIYLYTLAIPFTQISLQIGIDHYQEQPNPNENKVLHKLTIFVSILNFIQTVFISAIISNNEYDYSIIIKDHLSQPKNYFVYFRITIDFICSGVFLSSSRAIVELFNGITCLLRLAICVYRQPFYSRKTNKIYMQFTLFHLFLLILTVLLSLSKDNNLVSFSLLFCCGIPLCVKSGIMILKILAIENQFNQPFIEKEVNKINADKLDKHIRNIINLFSLSYEDYMIKGSGVKFETIFSNHLDNCCKVDQTSGMQTKNAIGSSSTKDENLCFCKQFQEFSSQRNFQSKNQRQQQQVTFTKDEVNLAISRVIGEDYRKSFLIKYTNNLIQKFFKSSNKNYQDPQLQIKPTYMYFLCQVAQTPALAFQQILLLKQQMKQSSFQTQALIQEIIDEINLLFSQYICSTTYQNQRLAISYVYEFDYLYKAFITSFKKALQSRQKYYEFLCSDYINLSDLLIESYSCLATKREAEYKINNLFDVHPTHPRLLAISELYIEFFDFRKRRVRHFIQKSQQIMSRNLQRVDLKINLFEQASCCLFVSLHSKQIIKLSNSVESFFKCQRSDLIGKQFSILLPDFIIPSFNKYLDVLLEEGNMDVIKLGEYLTFFNTPNTNTLYPIYLRMKIDILTNGEFGLSIFIQPAKNCKVSVITDLNFNIMSFTKEFQNLILKFLDTQNTTKSKSQDLIKGLNIQAVIPLLFSVTKITQDFNSFEGFNDTFGFKDQKIQNYTTYKSLLILPKNIKCLKNLNSFSNSTHKDVQNYFSSLNLQELEFLEITFSPFSYKLYSETQQPITLIEFQSYRKLKAATEINDQFLRLKETLTTYFQQEVNVPIIQTNSPKIPNQPETGTLSHLNLQMDKKYFLQQKEKYDERDTDGVQSQKSNGDSQKNNNSIQFEMYNDDIIQRYYDHGNSVDGDSPIQQESPQQVSEYINYIYERMSPQKRNSDYQQEITMNNEIQNEIGQRYKTLLKGVRDSKSTRFDESQQATTSRQSFISPRQPFDCVQNQYQSQEEIYKALYLNPISSPIINSTNSFVNLYEKQSTAPNRKESDSTANEKKRDSKQDGSITNDASQLNFINSQGELNFQKSRSKFFSQSRIQSVASQNLLSPLKQKKQAIMSQITQGSEKKENEDEEEDEDGVIQLSIMPSKQTSKKGKRGQLKSQKSGQFQDEESQNVKTNKKKAILDDQQSVRSGSSQIFSKKQSLYEMISSRRDTTEIQISKFIGLSAFLILIIISCVLFFQVKQNFQAEWTSYTNLIVGPNLLEGFAQILRVKELSTIIQVNQLYGYLFSSFKPYDLLLYKNESMQKLQYITQQIGSFQSTTIHDGFEDFMLNNSTQLVVINSVTSKQNSVVFSRLYSLLNLPSNLRKYLIENSEEARAFVYYNYASFISTIQNIQDMSTEQSKTTLDQTQSLLNMSIIVIEIVCVLTVLIVFPVYYIIQQKREEILCLLVTFDMQFLQSQIDKYRSAVYEKSIAESVSNFSKFERYATKTKAPSSTHQISIFEFSKQTKQNKNKKRQISHTKPLPKYSIKLSVIALAIFIVISLYSLLNYLFTKDFFSYFVYNIQELSLIAQSKSYLDLNYVGLYLLTNSYAYKFNSTTIGLIYQFFNQTILPNDQQRINALYNIDNGFINKRYNSDLYQQYFLDVIKTDACSILNTTYGQPYVNNNTMINITKCNQIQKGVLGNGLTFTFKQVFSQVQNYYSNFLLTAGNPIKFFGSLKQWDYDNNLKEFDYLYYYIRAILDSVSSFLIYESQQYFDYLMGVQKALFIYNLIIVFLVFAFAWTRFLQEMNKQIQETTYLLSLIPVEQLLDNPYIVSYINKVKNSIRNRQ